MSLPTSRNITYTPGVTKVRAVDMNDIQDSIVALSGGVASTLVRDHFTGSALNTGIWIPTSGTPTIVSDSANGGMGALQTATLGSDTRTTQFNIGTGNFTLSGRIRISTGPSGDAQFGIRQGGGVDLYIVADPVSSPGNWVPFVDGSFVTPNGTNFAISATYALFEIKRKSNVVTFKVNGVPLHTLASYTSSLNSAFIILQGGNATTVFFDYVEMTLFAF